MFWEKTNPTLRTLPLKVWEQTSSNLYLPLLTPYSDYDFANYQSIIKLEEGFWEALFPTFNYYDYLPFNRVPEHYNSQPENLSTLNKHYKLQFYSLEGVPAEEVQKKTSLKTFNTGYPTVVQSTLFFPQVLHSYTERFNEVALISDFMENEDSLQTYKGLTPNNMLNGSFLSGVSLPTVFPNSYLTVLNSFRGDLVPSY